MPKRPSTSLDLPTALEILLRPIHEDRIKPLPHAPFHQSRSHVIRPRPPKPLSALRQTFQRHLAHHSLKPDPAAHDIWSGEYGMAIMLELAAYRLTKNPTYLDTAKQYGDLALEVFWGKGPAGTNTPGILPRASSLTTYYDVVAYPDSLMLSLLALHEALTSKDQKVPLSTPFDDSPAVPLSPAKTGFD